MMPLSEIFFLGIVLYILYRFVFNFFLPVFKAARQVKQQFRNMREQGPASGEPHEPSYNRQSEDPQPKASRPKSSGSPGSMGEYIDFEEIK